MNTDQTPAKEPKLSFPLQDGETVLVLARRHWLFLWPKVALNALIGLAPVIVLRVLLDWVDVDLGEVFWLLAAIWLLFWAVRGYLEWYRYHNDIWVITNQRLVDVYKSNPFNLRVASADLVNIQDMSVERHGIFGTVLNYGDVLCQTAGANESFCLSSVPNPRELQARLDQERDRERLRPGESSSV